MPRQPRQREQQRTAREAHAAIPVPTAISPATAVVPNPVPTTTSPAAAVTVPSSIECLLQGEGEFGHQAGRTAPQLEVVADEESA